MKTSFNFDYILNDQITINNTLKISNLPKDYSIKDGYIYSPIDKAPMLLVLGGPSIIGNETQCGYKDEYPAHEVYIETFLIDVYKVTVKRYKTFLDALADYGNHNFLWCNCHEPADKNHLPKDWEEQLLQPSSPVTGIDWYDAWAYTQWSQKMLPTEAQWEKACNPQFILFPNFNKKIKKYQYSISNMLGKGWEWCLDWYKENYYDITSRYEPCYTKKTQYKITKGSLPNNSLPVSRSSFRNRYPIDWRESMLSFRCIKRIK